MRSIQIHQLFSITYLGMMQVNRFKDDRNASDIEYEIFNIFLNLLGLACTVVISTSTHQLTICC